MARAILGDGLQDGDLLGRRAALVAQAEGVGGADDHIGLVATGGLQALPALEVQHQADARAAGLMRQGGHDLLGPRHLRHALGVDEGRGLDAGDPAGLQPVDQLDAVVHRQDGGLRLQSVARADLDDLDFAAHGRSPVSRDRYRIRSTGLPLL